MKHFFKNHKYILVLALSLILASCKVEEKQTTDIAMADKSEISFGTKSLAEEVFDPTSGSFGGEVYRLDIEGNPSFYFNIYQYGQGKVDKVLTSEEFKMDGGKYLVLEVYDYEVNAHTVNDNVTKNVLNYEVGDKDFYNTSLNTWDWTEKSNFKDGGAYLFQSAGSNGKVLNTYELNETGLKALENSNGSGLVVELRMSDR